ncbi:MAG TPA: PA0069 family radical SAM protein [Thermoanaerobaculia bacterium]|nr:PA0069 family radical SAM protein [Thermoanaerobaculia bacterium]
MDPPILPSAPRGRGTGLNPANRFEPIEVELEEPGLERVRTQYLRDVSRSIIATNDSPDVGFDASVNPYRGCEHGCVYCLDGDTPVLMGDGSARQLRRLQVGDEIYGTRRDGWYRRYVKTRVLAHWESTRPAYAVTLADGRRLVAGADHRFLTERGWKFVTGQQQGDGRRPHLTLRNKLMGTGRFVEGPDITAGAYRRGYLCGLIRGDGHLASYEYQRSGRVHGNQHRFRLALTDREPLDRARLYLEAFGVGVSEFVFQSATADRRHMQAIRTSSRQHVERIRELIDKPLHPPDGWWRGFLAGIYDAEGCFSDGTLRISNTDPALVAWLGEGLRSLGLGSVLEERPGINKPVQVVRLTGGLAACLHLWQATSSAIGRKRELGGTAIKSGARLAVMAVEPLGPKRLFDVTTGTGDFIADGVVSHNCYARPTHEYFGLSAGLDFETRIFVKEEAPALLREALASPRWTPKVLAMSGVTDPYQPIERKLGITRGCLEVLAEFRNPVGIITKNRLVTRDLDLLGELAADGAASVTLSITTLDADLAARMEPRASHPRDRLRALEELAAAGIPCGVMVAPVVPAVTDHELPRILEAAAAAGASHAGYVMLRLPWAIKDLFADWLEHNFPDRREKVLARLRELRGGKLYDATFGNRMRGEGPFAEQIRALFVSSRRRAGLDRPRPELSTAAFRRTGEQRSLW